MVEHRSRPAGVRPPRASNSCAQSCGKTRGQDTVWGAIGYQISLSASDSPESAGSDLCRLAASSDWKVESGAASSQLAREAADPIVIRTSCWVVYGRKIKMAAPRPGVYPGVTGTHRKVTVRAAG